MPPGKRRKPHDPLSTRDLIYCIALDVAVAKEALQSAGKDLTFAAIKTELMEGAGKPDYITNVDDLIRGAIELSNLWEAKGTRQQYARSRSKRHRLAVKSRQGSR